MSYRIAGARRFLSSLGLAGMLAAVWSTAAGADGATGIWWNAAKTVQVEIRQEADRLSGRIVWLREPLDEAGRPKRDLRNPDPALRDETVLGLEVLTGLRPHHKRENVWFGGTAYDANRGRRYRCTVKRVDADRVWVRGYVGIPLLGRTEWWTRVSEQELATTAGAAPDPVASAAPPAPAAPAVSALHIPARPASRPGG